jgi:hypothetical protein
MDEHRAALAAAAGRVWPRRLGRVALLTGQSRLNRSPLTPDQTAFLQAVTPPSYEAVRAGLPYADTPSEPQPGLAGACLANARQYRWARSDRSYGRLVAGALSPMLAESDRTLLVAASAGLALLQAAWPHLAGPRRRLAVLCLGPAGAPPDFGGEVRVEVVQGRRDGWSRALYAGPVQHHPSCGHMGYWRNAEVRAVAHALAVRLAAEDRR